MATRKKPLHWYYALFLPRSRHAAWRMNQDVTRYGLRAPIQASSNINARKAYRAERNSLNPDAELVLFRDLTDAPPAFLSDLELATIAENTQRRFGPSEDASQTVHWDYHRHAASAFVNPTTGECFFPVYNRSGNQAIALPGTELIAELHTTEFRQRRLRDDVWGLAPPISEIHFALHNGHVLQKI